MTSTPTEERARVLRVARKLQSVVFRDSTFSYELLAQEVLEAADAPETQKVVVTEEMKAAGYKAYVDFPIDQTQHFWYEAVTAIYTAMRALEPEPVVTQEVAMDMSREYSRHSDGLTSVTVAQAVLSAAHRVLRGK